MSRTVARIGEASTLAAIRRAWRGKGTEAVFASCTNLHSLGIVDQAEAEPGLPVVTSNQAVLGHPLGLARADMQGCGPGRLFPI